MDKKVLISGGMDAFAKSVEKLISIKTLDEMAGTDELCKYCHFEPSLYKEEHCGDAYENYVEENGCHISSVPQFESQFTNYLETVDSILKFDPTNCANNKMLDSVKSEQRPDLSPCPFCDVVPGFHTDFPVADLHAVACENTDCKVKPYTVGKSVEEAIERWNKRPVHDSDDNLMVKYEDHYVPKKLCTFTNPVTTPEGISVPDDCDSCGAICESVDQECADCCIQQAFDKLGLYESGLNRITRLMSTMTDTNSLRLLYLALSYLKGE